MRMLGICMPFACMIVLLFALFTVFNLIVRPTGLFFFDIAGVWSTMGVCYEGRFNWFGLVYLLIPLEGTSLLLGRVFIL